MKLTTILARTQLTVIAEMANIPSDVSGIGSVYMYASTKDVAHGRHGPRIKISNVPGRFDPNNCFVMTIDKFAPAAIAGPPKLPQSILNDIEDWVRQNYEVLMSYWNKAPYKLPNNTTVGPFNNLVELQAALRPLT
jgi:hypothetical protein